MSEPCDHLCWVECGRVRTCSKCGDQVASGAPWSDGATSPNGPPPVDERVRWRRIEAAARDVVTPGIISRDDAVELLRIALAWEVR